jgi:hypothetical protein
MNITFNFFYKNKKMNSDKDSNKDGNKGANKKLSYYQRNRIHILQKSREKYQELKNQGLKNSYRKKEPEDKKSSGKRRLTDEEKL